MPPKTQIPLAVADQLGRELRRRLRVRWDDRDGESGGHRVTVIAVGAARRRARRCGDLDFLVVSPHVGAATPSVRLAGRGRLALGVPFLSGPRRVSAAVAYFVGRGAAKIRRRCSVDLFFARPEEKPFALFHYTGAASYNTRTRALAKRRGLLLNQYGLFVLRSATSPRIAPHRDAACGATGCRRVRGSAAVHTEKQLAALLGVHYRKPQDRR